MSVTSSNASEFSKPKSQIDQLIEITNTTDFVTLKVILYEKKELYLKCLELLLAN